MTVPAMRVLIRPEARKDLSDASAVRQQLLQIRSRPEAFPPFHRQTRRLQDRGIKVTQAALVDFDDGAMKGG